MAEASRQVDQGYGGFAGAIRTGTDDDVQLDGVGVDAFGHDLDLISQASVVAQLQEELQLSGMAE